MRVGNGVAFTVQLATCTKSSNDTVIVKPLAGGRPGATFVRTVAIV